MMKKSYVAKTADANGIIAYTAEENDTWRELMTRQMTIVQNRACDEYIEGLRQLNMPTDKIPQPLEMSTVLTKATGWSVTPVPALIPYDHFFNLLANRQFPAASFIRYHEELDYLQEPDIFHEFFGHCPMLTDPVYADFMQQYGKMGLAANEEDRIMLARLYWFTVEFGLINTAKGLRAYGGGILSSKNETIYCVESAIPIRKPFSGLEALRTPYRIDIMQPIYFVIDDFKELYELISTDIFATIAEARRLGEYPPLFATEDNQTTPPAWC